jgi:hypothetical protein
MKKVILIIFPLLLFIPAKLLGQVDILNIDLTDSTLNFIYTGLDNDLLITGLRDTSELKFTGYKIKVTRNKDRLIATSSSVGIDTLKVFKKDKLLLAKVFEIRKWATPFVRLGDIKDTVASVQEIILNPVLIYVRQDYYRYYSWVEQFALTITGAKGNTLRPLESVEGNRLTEEMLRDIKKLKPGNKLSFEFIRIACADCSRPTMPAFTIMIK